MKITKIRDVKTPVRGTEKSAGIDFFCPNDMLETELWPGDGILIPSGIKAKVPEGFALICMNKSGVAVKKHLVVGAQVVDEDYQGEIHLHLFNIGTENVIVSPGEKILQMLLIPVNYANIEIIEDEEALYCNEATERSTNGFGSTGTF